VEVVKPPTAARLSDALRRYGSLTRSTTACGAEANRSRCGILTQKPARVPLTNTIGLL
jgi:hypothetical protein